LSVKNPAVPLCEQTVNEVLRTIRVLFEPGDLIEIRALDIGRTQDHAGSTYAGYFNIENSQAITRAIRLVDARSEGVYVVLNRFNRDLLARSNNRLRVRPKHTTSDADIIEWRWMYIDADAIRPAGISATDAEHQAALQRTLSIRQFLEGRGWPEPIYADSGNGGHLLYLLPALNLECAADLVKRCLRALATRFSDPVVKVDESTATRARICKLYGTFARKGDPTLDRPHRRSKILDDPEHLQAVPREVLEALAAEVQNALPRTATRLKEVSTASRFDIDRWLEFSLLDVIKGPDPYKEGRRWTLRTCLFNLEHERPVILQLPNGALVYKCLHNSCAQNDWSALRTLIELNRGVFNQSEKSSPVTTAEQPVVSQQDCASLITDLSQLPSVWKLESSLVWSVEEMIAQGSVTLICAESGTGKTWYGYYLAGCVAHGLPVIGLKSRRSKVLYVDGENPLYVVKQRLFDLGIQDTADLAIWGGWVGDPPPSPNNPLVVNFAREYKGLIIYDSLIEFHPGSEQSSTETRSFMRQFRVLANLGATIVVLHHTGKADSSKQYRGSSDIKAVVDTAYLLEKDSDDPERLGKLSLTCFKGRLMPGRHFGFEFRQGQGFVSCERGPAEKRVEDAVTEFVESTPGLNQSTIVRKVREKGFAKGAIERCLKNGVFQKQTGPRHSTLYTLRRKEVDPGFEV
jgi:AAA domain